MITEVALALALAANPPEFVSPELLPYVDRFEQALEERGLTIVTGRHPENFDWRLNFTTGVGSITISAELLRNGKVVVSTPVKNRALFKSSEIPDTAVLAAQRFSKDIGLYLSTFGYQSTPVAKSRAPAASWQDVKVYYRPPGSRYEEIGMLEASSSGSWAFSSQGKLNKVIDRLKAQAFKMGANGVLLIGVGNEYRGSVNTANASAYGTGNAAYGTAYGTSIPIIHKSGSAIAIRVHEDESPADVASPAAVTPRTETDVTSRPPESHSQSDRVTDVYESILKLDELRKRGLLTDEEFNAEKQKLLSGD